MYVLTKAQEKLLEEAIDSAESWEGALIGNPDPEPLDTFRFEIAAMRGALTFVLEQQKQLRKIRTVSRKLGSTHVYCYIGPEDGGCVDVGSFDLL